ncbi:MAG TPA: hypothetical protein VHS09_01595 [Polyangiaceae bacterium]|nr:hypothetical protein [Polyangiaceae bacterium]
MGARALCGALVVAIVDVALRKVGLIGEGSARVVLGVAAAGVLVASVAAWSWRLPERAGARALDRFHGLHDRLASALSFGASAERTPFMDAAIEDAVSAAAGAKPHAAVRLPVPRSLGTAVGLAGVLAGVLLFEVRHHVPVAHATMIDPMEMAPDDLEDVKDFLQQLKQKDQSDDTKAAIDEFNKLVDDIANKRLDRTEAFRRMEALEQKLLTGSKADKKSLEEQLEKIGEEMKKAELTKPAGEALADNKLEQARDAMHELAKKMREQGGQVDKAKLEQMRQALQKAAADAEQRQQRLEQRRQELADEILKRKEKAPDGGSEEEQSLLQKKQRELERLDRDLDQEKNSGRQLDRLDRELQQAAEDLMKDMGLTAKDLDQGAEDINQMQQQQMSEQEKEELKQKLQEMRELMRQQGQGGKGQIVRLKRFGRMARGQGGQQGQGQGQQGEGEEGQDGQGQQGQGQQGQGQQGQGGQGQQGQNGQGGQGQQGQNGQGGQGGQGGETWVLGPNGEKLLMLSKGQGGSGSSPGSGQGGSGGEGQGQPGRGWGEWHDPKTQAGATNPKMGTQDTQVQGADANGGSRSQVILGAAERGFASRGYKKVYTEYHQVAEESLAKDEIPGGYRFYVKRYFQLIRPREEK